MGSNSNILFVLLDSLSCHLTYRLNSGIGFEVKPFFLSVELLDNNLDRDVRREESKIEVGFGWWTKPTLS